MTNQLTYEYDRELDFLADYYDRWRVPANRPELARTGQSDIAMNLYANLRDVRQNDVDFKQRLQKRIAEWPTRKETLIQQVGRDAMRQQVTKQQPALMPLLEKRFSLQDKYEQFPTLTKQLIRSGMSRKEAAEMMRDKEYEVGVQKLQATVSPGALPEEFEAFVDKKLALYDELDEKWLGPLRGKDDFTYQDYQRAHPEQAEADIQGRLQIVNDDLKVFREGLKQAKGYQVPQTMQKGVMGAALRGERPATADGGFAASVSETLRQLSGKGNIRDDRAALAALRVVETGDVRLSGVDRLSPEEQGRMQAYLGSLYSTMPHESIFRQLGGEALTELGQYLAVLPKVGIPLAGAAAVYAEQLKGNPQEGEQLLRTFAQGMAKSLPVAGVGAAIPGLGAGFWGGAFWSYLGASYMNGKTALGVVPMGGWKEKAQALLGGMQTFGGKYVFSKWGFLNGALAGTGELLRSGDTNKALEQFGSTFIRGVVPPALERDLDLPDPATLTGGALQAIGVPQDTANTLGWVGDLVLSAALLQYGPKVVKAGMSKLIQYAEAIDKRYPSVAQYMKRTAQWMSEHPPGMTVKVVGEEGGETTGTIVVPKRKLDKIAPPTAPKAEPVVPAKMRVAIEGGTRENRKALNQFAKEVRGSAATADELAAKGQKLFPGTPVEEVKAYVQAVRARVQKPMIELSPLENADIKLKEIALAAKKQAVKENRIPIQQTIREAQDMGLSLDDIKAFVKERGKNELAKYVALTSEQAQLGRGKMKVQIDSYFQNPQSVSAEQAMAQNLKAVAFDHIAPAEELRSGIGRALRQAREVSVLRQVDRIVENIMAYPKAQRDELWNALRLLDWDNTYEVRNFLFSMKKPTFMELINGVRYNSMLSSPRTHVQNVASTALWTSFVQLFKRSALPPVDWTLNVLTGGKHGRHYFWREVPVALRGVKEGAKLWWDMGKDGVQAGVNKARHDLMVNGFDKMGKWQEAGPQMGAWKRWAQLRGPKAKALAKFIEAPGDLLNKEDLPFQIINYTAEIHAEATRKAIQLSRRLPKETRASEFAWARKNLVDHPTDDMVVNAYKAAQYGTFRDEPGSILNAFIRLRDAVPFFGTLFVPFLRTPGNLFARGAELTPGVGFGYQLWKTGGKPTAAQLTEMLTNQTIGILATVGIAMSVANEDITAWAPRSAAGRDEWARLGKQEWGVRVGDQWFGLNRLEPFNVPFAVIAAMKRYAEEKGIEVNPDVAEAITVTMGRAMLNHSYFMSVNQVLDAMTAENTRGIGAILSRAGTSFVPYSGFLRYVRDEIQAITKGGVRREKAESYLQELQRLIPGDILKLEQPRLPRNLWGEKQVYPAPARTTLIPLVKWRESSTDPVDLEMDRLDVVKGRPEPDHKIGKVPLEPLWEDLLLEKAGQISRRDMEQLLARPEYKQAPDEERLKAINRVFDNAREIAKRIVLSMMMDRMGTRQEKVKFLQDAGEIKVGER